MNAIESSIYQDLLDALQILKPNTTPSNPSTVNTYRGVIPNQYILYGPPGTGKTHTLQTKYISKFADDNRFVTTFHQSFSYEEFVEGLKPILVTQENANDSEDTQEDSLGDVKYKVVKGIFRIACDRAAFLAGYKSLKECIEDTFENRQIKFSQAIKDNKTVLLGIDEINRGNIASIFGDLISLIESSKRLGVDNQSEMIVTLPYSQDKFGVPANLLIVGTMNTSDRSIKLLDSALRRRFKFKELLPNYSVFVPNPNDNQMQIQAINDAKIILENINTRIRCLLNKDSQIGHSYLMFAKSDKAIFTAIVNKIIPLLEEYFYNDIEKVRFVLNENSKTKYPFYQEDKDVKKAFEAYLLESDIEEEDKTFYELNYSIKDDGDYKKYLIHLLGKDDSNI